MNHLLDNFELLLEAPDGVKRLREIILQLAVMGKLVPQDPNDEPASVLLEKIKEEKERLIQDGKLKADKPLPPIKKDEIPYELPKGWEWVRLNNVFDVRDGTHDSPKYLSTGIPFITSKNISTGKLDFNNVQFISIEDHLNFKKRSKVDKDDILMAMIGSIGNPVIVDTYKEFSIKNIALIKYYNRCFSNPNYLKHYLEVISQSMKEKSSGGVQAFISLNFLRKYLFPLPPLAEQQRIVSKVDQLMELCDELEKRIGERNKSQVSLNNAALNKLSKAADMMAFQNEWERIITHFDTLFAKPENVKSLKQTILQLAVMGKLVPQDPNDEPASVLLEKIKEEKERLIQEGKLKAEKPLPPIKKDEIPYELPKGWEWVRINSICITITDGEHFTPEYSVKGIPIFSAKNIGDKIIEVNDLKFVSEEVARKCWNRCFPEKGDILVVSRGGGIGRTVISNIENYCLMGSVLVFKIVKKTYNKYLFSYLNSPLGNNLLKKTSNYTAQQAIYIAHLKKNYIIPLPPLAEQQRIVEKVDRLMELCDRLEERLKQSENERETLFKSVANHISLEN